MMWSMAISIVMSVTETQRLRVMLGTLRVMENSAFLKQHGGSCIATASKTMTGPVRSWQFRGSALHFIYIGGESMASRTVTNTLLALVVLCLTLIVIKLYDTTINPAAEAARIKDASPTTTSTALVGCYLTFLSNDCEWRYIQVTDEGYLMTTK
jgi:hypothetical protein